MLVPVLSGLLVVPSVANAGLFSFFGGEEALADTRIEVSFNNSQNMALLQANAFSAPIFKDIKNTKDTKDTEGDLSYDELDNSNIISDNALNPTVGPLGVTDGTEYTEISPEDVSIYIVRNGDSLSQIADMFGVSVNTILWANDMKKSDKLRVGDTLFILPVSGVKHIVKKGQTLKSIAKLYKVDTATITGFNGISEDSTLSIGDELIIPEAQMPNDDVPSTKSSGTKSVPVYTGALKNLSNYFINPVPDLKRRSQNLHGPGNRGVDLAAPTGTKILASAEGKVLLARTGYNGGYGNMVIIQHPNGTKTLYGHMYKIATKTGAQVAQGEVIGYVGNTGRSTGPHLHFEVFNAKNPGSDWSWAK